MLKNLSVFMVCAALCGCVGSTFLVDDTDHGADFPSLYSVPERPDTEELSRREVKAAEHADLKDKLSTSQDATLDENEKLRRDMGL